MSIYKPREDSYLLAEQVKKHAKGAVLDMCTGTGIQAITAAKNRRVKKVLAVDINRQAIAYAKKHSSHKKITYKISDLFSAVPGGRKFDTIICNPPYLPDEPKAKDIALDGGRKGYEFTERFLDSAGEYLKKDGAVLLLFSSLTKKHIVEKIIEKNAFEFRKLSSMKFAFEELFVYRIFYPEQIKKLFDRKIKNIKRLTQGHRGLIYTGLLNNKKVSNKKVSIKIQRKDIGARGTVNNEAKQLKILNRHNIGPRVLLVGNNFFIYEFVEGDFIMDFIGKSNKKTIQQIITQIFLQMKKMDGLGLNKEEMHHPLKHIVVGKGKTAKPVLLDFERCKKAEKTHNVTQFCEFIARISPELAKKGIKVDAEKMRDLAVDYRKNKHNFNNILKYILPDY